MAERSVNKAILVGRLGADAETRFTQNGTPVSRVSLAMNRQWTDSDNQVHEETDWMSNRAPDPAEQSLQDDDVPF